MEESRLTRKLLIWVVYWISVKIHVHLFYNYGFREAFFNHEKINTRLLGESVLAESKVG